MSHFGSYSQASRKRFVTRWYSPVVLFLENSGKFLEIFERHLCESADNHRYFLHMNEFRFTVISPFGKI